MPPAKTNAAESKPEDLSSEGEENTSTDAPEVEDKATTADEQLKPAAEITFQSHTSTADGSPLTSDSAPPLPEEEPPLPEEEPPAPLPEDDGWAPVWEESAQAFYFYNRFTQATQWTNPRVPEETPVPASAPNTVPADADEVSLPPRPSGGYDPAIHGDYDSDAWYAQEVPVAPTLSNDPDGAPVDPAAAYGATGAFNRFTGRWQAADVGPEMHNDENKSKRQMNAFFDVDAAANSHDGRSLKAERSGKKLSRNEVKGFKEKRKAKKEEKRRAWLRD